MTDLEKRLSEYLTRRSFSARVFKLTPDASTREYFRVEYGDVSAIACVYPEPFSATEHSYLDVTSLFQRSGLPVANIYDFDEDLGVIIQEDLGDTILRNVLLEASDDAREALLNQAISLIPQIHAATPLAISTGSIASKLSFDTEKLMWELDFFKTHYFGTLRGRPLDTDTDRDIERDFNELSEQLASKANVLCHRDFHAANLMVDQKGQLRIIDHQDARMGSVAYDLVSLLLDRVNEPPSESWLDEKITYFWGERDKLSLPALDKGSFDHEFKMQTVQRCLKAVGTFSFQAVNRGKDYFLPFIRPMFQIVDKALVELGTFPTLAKVVSQEADES